MKKIFVLFLFFTFCLNFYNPSMALYVEDLKARVEKNETLKDPGLIKIPQIKEVDEESYNKKMASDEIEYEKIKSQTGDNFEIYKILERILRANKLQYQNWRIAFYMDHEDINANAGAYNLIQISSALYDSLYPDDDAIAFVISHELAHLILNHAKATNEIRYKINQLEEKIKINKYEIRRTQNISDIQSAFGDDIGSIGNLLANVSGNIAVDMLTKNLKREYGLLRQMEYAADSQALVLMTKAGYNPQSCLEVMNVLSGLGGLDKELLTDTHPSDKSRTDNLNSKLYGLNKQKLQKEGRYNIYNSNVLNARATTDKKAVLIQKDINVSKTSYIPESEDSLFLIRGYINYKNKKMPQAQSNFQNAFEVNPSNYISTLYLSYINEYLYHKNNDKEYLKQAKHWINKAYKINPNEINILRQKEELSKLK